MTIDELVKEEETIENTIKGRWEKKNPPKKELILDGVVSAEKYLDKKNTKYKIMWMLKEGYKDLGFKLGTDLLEQEQRIKKATNGLEPTLRGMIYVTYGLLNDVSFEKMITHEIDSEMIEALTRTAWVNISKVRGKSKSEDEDIKKEYAFWKEILFKQIKTYSPDILIFGGTVKFFENDWLELFGELLPDPHYFSKILNDMLVILPYHPSAPFYEDPKISIQEYVDEIIEEPKAKRFKK
jgi:hypothetical protein